MPSYAIICHHMPHLDERRAAFGVFEGLLSIKSVSKIHYASLRGVGQGLEPNSASRSSGVDAHVFSRRWLVCDQCHSAVHRHAREHRASQARICFKGSNKQLELAKKQFADVQLTHFQIDVCQTKVRSPRELVR